MSKRRVFWAANHAAAGVDECRTSLPDGMDFSGFLLKNFMIKGFLYEVTQNQGESVVRVDIDTYLLTIETNKADVFVLQGLCLKAKSQKEIKDCLTAELFADYDEIERAAFSALYQIEVQERIDVMLASGKTNRELLLEALAETGSIRFELIKRVEYMVAKVKSNSPMLSNAFGL